MEKKKHTYKAVIRHDPEEYYDYVEWVSGKPKTNVPLEVEISVWEEDGDEPQTNKERRAKAAAALREIAKRGEFPKYQTPWLGSGRSAKTGHCPGASYDTSGQQHRHILCRT